MKEPSEEMIIELVNSFEHRNVLTALEVELSLEVMKQSREIKELKKRNKELEDGFKSSIEELTEYATLVAKIEEEFAWLNKVEYNEINCIAFINKIEKIIKGEKDVKS